MTLEDFFTLSEMKDGLVTLARVEDLVLTMQKQRDFVMANAGDAARQWSTVARTLAITENEECLDHFVQLEGLSFLNQWLQEAQKFANDIGENNVNEVMGALLSSLERLPIDWKKSSDVGIGMTVEQLLNHVNVGIKERARNLLNKWKHSKALDARCHYMERGGPCQNGELEHFADAKATDDGILSELPALNFSSSEVIAREGTAEVSSGGIEDSKSSYKFPADSVNNVKPTVLSNSTDVNLVSGDIRPLYSSLQSNSFMVNLPTAEEDPVCPAIGLPSASACNSPNSKRRDGNDQHHATEFKDAVNCCKERKVDTDRNTDDLSCADKSAIIAAERDQKEPYLCCKLDSMEDGSSRQESAEPQPNLECINNKGTKYFKAAKEFRLPEAFEDKSSNVAILRNRDSPDNTRHRKDGVRIKEIVGESYSKASKGVELPCSNDSSKAQGIREVAHNGNRSEFGLDGEIDALELARQVAIEVEREVADYREQFCSSPDVHSREFRGANNPDVREGEQSQPEVNFRAISDSSSSDIAGSGQDPVADHTEESMDTGNLDFIEGKLNQPVVKESEGSKSRNESEILDGEYSAKENSLRTSQQFIGHEDSKQYMELVKSSIAQEAGNKLGRNLCSFDLNEDAPADDLDCSACGIPNVLVNLSAPVAVLGVSKGAPDSLASPFNFGGEHGWRGSAATSAFRPASSRRSQDCEKASSGPNQKSNILDFDLNTNEDEDDVAVNHVAAKPAPVSSDLPSGDSSIEVSSRKKERVRLDLNSLGDEDRPSHLSHWRLQQGGNQSPSAASSSSSRQPSTRDFDLNDNPSVSENDGHRNFNQSSSKDIGMRGSSKLDEPFVTIMGSRVPMEKKDCSSQPHQSYPRKGLGLGHSMAARTTHPSAHMPPPAYIFNGLQTASVMSMPPLYGSGNLPHVVDSRGGPVIPQILDSAGVNGVPPASRPFLMTVASDPSSSNGVWPSQSGLHLNLSMSLVENGKWEGESLKQSYTPEPEVSPGVGLMTTSQPVNSGMLLKRKEPECGWDPYGCGYKQVTPWQ